MVFEYDIYFNSKSGLYEIYQNGKFIFKTNDKYTLVVKVVSLLDTLGGELTDDR